MSRIKALWSSPSRWIILLVAAILMLVVVGILNFLVKFQQAATPHPARRFLYPARPAAYPYNKHDFH